jgi:ABC-type Na+ efflux pump permease subunit
MSRLLRIALREYLSYVRTVGFWLSLALLPVILSAAVGIPLTAPWLAAPAGPSTRRR